MIVGGIFGPKKSGKTTLANKLAEEYWNQEGRRTLVLDPNQTDAWGPSCWQPDETFHGKETTAEEREAQFWHTVWSTTNCLVICDDAGKTIDRDDSLTDVFTRINHNGHKLLVIGHSGTNLNPTMRQQMDVIYLFRTTPSAAKAWYEVFGYEEIKSSYTLDRYEFFYVRQYEGVQKLKLDIGTQPVP